MKTNPELIEEYKKWISVFDEPECRLLPEDYDIIEDFLVWLQNEDYLVISNKDQGKCKHKFNTRHVWCSKCGMRKTS